MIRIRKDNSSRDDTFVNPRHITSMRLHVDGVTASLYVAEGYAGTIFTAHFDSSDDREVFRKDVAAAVAAAQR